jgi:eukaryotic-like serine/threonine-protein kinase
MEDLQGGTLALEHRYEVIERRGRRGFITLYGARQDPFDKPVWVKAYDGLATAGVQPDLFDRLKEAAQQASGLTTPGMLRVIDYGELAAGVPFVVSERIEAPSLAELLDEEGTLSIAATAALIERLATVLEPAHQRGNAHGFIAPEWIYVPDDDPGAAHLDHFQLTVTVAEIVASDSAVMSVDAISAFAPEMFERGEDDPPARGGFSPAGDVWALGVLAYLCLVGVHPIFDDDLDASAGILKLRNERPRPLEELGVDAQISSVIDRALQPDPAQRFQNVAAFAQALQDLVAPQPAASPAAPPAEPGPASDDEPANPEAPPALDAPRERPPGPSDHLLTLVIVLLFLTNLAWLFYVAGADSADEASAPSENTPAATSVIEDR